MIDAHNNKLLTSPSKSKLAGLIISRFVNPVLEYQDNKNIKEPKKKAKQM